MPTPDISWLSPLPIQRTPGPRAAHPARRKHPLVAGAPLLGRARRSTTLGVPARPQSVPLLTPHLPDVFTFELRYMHSGSWFIPTTMARCCSLRAREPPRPYLWLRRPPECCGPFLADTEWLVLRVLTDTKVAPLRSPCARGMPWSLQVEATRRWWVVRPSPGQGSGGATSWALRPLACVLRPLACDFASQSRSACRSWQEGEPETQTAGHRDQEPAHQSTTAIGRILSHTACSIRCPSAQCMMSWVDRVQLRRPGGRRPCLSGDDGCQRCHR